MEKLYRCEEVANRYEVQITTVYDWIRKKNLPALKIGKSYMVQESDLKQFEEMRKTVKLECVEED
ncbi:MAG: helix-turn-helix domain-containing protein [Negativibacillus sp.]|nr:helix-turn-helix domain-containing protein [Negativibacillus sp.]